MVQLEDNIVGLDSSIFTRPEVWVASGHVGGFSDPVVECRECNARSRADHLIEEAGGFADEKMTPEEINKVFKEYSEKISMSKVWEEKFFRCKKF